MQENIKSVFLKNIKLFSSLTDEELEQICSRISVKEFKKNEVILFEEDVSNFMYIILFGKVKVVQSTEDGKEIILAFHHSEEFFGEISLIDGNTSPATVLADEECLIAIVSRKDFYTLLAEQSKILHTVLQILCSRLRKSWEQIQILNFRDARKRIKMLFLMFSHENCEKTPDGIVLNIKLTHQDIADMTGLARETVTRILSKLQHDGEISILKNRIIRLNPLFMKKGEDF
jgi:CRP/FNR family transcriptional regulator